MKNLKRITAVLLAALGGYALIKFDGTGVIRDTILPEHKYATLVLGGVMLAVGGWLIYFKIGWRLFFFALLAFILTPVVYYAAAIQGHALLYLIGFLTFAGMCILIEQQNKIEKVF